MKFVSLRTKRAHRRGKLEKELRVSHESFANPPAAPGQIHTYAELRQQIHHDLRVQHPEWVHPDGKSPMCDSYEARLMELLDPLIRRADSHGVTTQKGAGHASLSKMSAMEARRNEQDSIGVSAAADVYELRLRRDRDGFDLVSDDFRSGPIWYSGPDAVRRAVLFARYRSRTRTHYATVRVLDVTGAVIQAYEPTDDFRE